MILNYFSALWTSFAPTLGNHLWQSTLFAVVAGLLTFVLRKNRARTRYWLWLSASVKFLFPFSLLVGIGSDLAWSRGTNTGLYLAMKGVGQPFTQPTIPTYSQAAQLTVSTSLIYFLPVFLTTLWLCGFLMVLCLWYVRWRRISAVAREAVPLREGREAETLRRVERMQGLQKPIEIRLSSTSLEPGIFGIIRPVLVWPEGISERLDNAHLEAILAHELCHVRRRDNLAAAFHMVVEAIFWFHPLIWWLEVRLMEERERACDEEVLESGSDRQVYAESILKICEFCVGSPLACVSGVTGADLKKRIARIMAGGLTRKLDFSRKLLLSAAALAAIALPVAFGPLHETQARAESQAQNTATIAPLYEVVSQEPSKSDDPAVRIRSQAQKTAAIAPSYEIASIKPNNFNNPTARIESQAQNTATIEPRYEVASIKPNKSAGDMIRLTGRPDGFTGTNITLQMLIRNAYEVEDNQISGGPSWIESEKYDIEAKMDGAVADELRKLGEDQSMLERQRMLQALLADRVKLSIHFETKEDPAYALVFAKNGPRLQEAKPGESYANGIKGFDGLPIGPHKTRMASGELTVQALPMVAVARLLSMHLGRTVLDKTGLMGSYDFTLLWTPEEGETAVFNGPKDSQVRADSTRPESSGPSIFAAIQEQLGLKLESQKGPVKILVIDHAERPSEN